MTHLHIRNIICLFSNEELRALQTLNAFIELTNETIGDAFSDFLLIESILHAKDWNVKNWRALYDDLPYQQSKVTVAVSIVYKFLTKYILQSFKLSNTE